MSKGTLLALVTLLLAPRPELLAATAPKLADKPNILWLIAEDLYDL